MCQFFSFKSPAETSYYSSLNAPLVQRQIASARGPQQDWSAVQPCGLFDSPGPSVDLSDYATSCFPSLWPVPQRTLSGWCWHLRIFEMHAEGATQLKSPPNGPVFAPPSPLAVPSPSLRRILTKYVPSMHAFLGRQQRKKSKGRMPASGLTTLSSQPVCATIHHSLIDCTCLIN